MQDFQVSIGVLKKAVDVDTVFDLATYAKAGA
jgi:hypothetical protein